MAITARRRSIAIPTSSLHHSKWHLHLLRLPSSATMKSEEPDLPFSFPSSSLISSTKRRSKETVAIVTRAYKEIEFVLVKRLEELGLTVILTARDVERRQNAVEALSAKGLFVNFFRLDVSDQSSIKSLVSWFRSNFGVLDILYN